MSIFKTGVLITGESGIGKSEVALSLLTQDHGHQLIADDVIEFYKGDDGGIFGRAPALLRDFMEVRGLGILNTRALFGDGACADYHALHLAVELKAFDPKKFAKVSRTEQPHKTCTIIDHAIPQLIIPVAPGRNIAALVETAVHNYYLRVQGYDSHEDFIQRQRKLSHGNANNDPES